MHYRHYARIARVINRTLLVVCWLFLPCVLIGRFGAAAEHRLLRWRNGSYMWALRKFTAPDEDVPQ